MKSRVIKKKIEADGICSFELVNASGGTLPVFAAGSHIDVTCPNGMVRQYSLCNSPNEHDRYLIAVLNDPASRGGSRAMHEMVSEGMELDISEPKNHFSLAHTEGKSILFAAGIGITPILCMAERLQSTGRQFKLYYTARSRNGMAFVEQIESSTFFNHTELFFSGDGEPSRMDIAGILEQSGSDTHIYVCGPQRFIQSVLDNARSAGWPEDRIHYEFFKSEKIAIENDGSFNIKIASTGHIVVVPKDKTVIQSLAAAGIEIPTSCEQGVCGTCITRVLNGECDHRDLFLMDDEKAQNNQFLPCVSRAKSDMLVLDI